MLALLGNGLEYISVVNDILDNIKSLPELSGAACEIVEGEILATIAISKDWKSCAVEIGPENTKLTYSGSIGSGQCDYQFNGVSLDESCIQAIKDTMK